MGVNDVAQFLIVVAALAVAAPLLGRYIAAVFGGGHSPGDRVFGLIERPIYRLARVDEQGEQRWRTYALSLLSFSLVSVLILYGIQRFQAHLPLNPGGATSVAPPLAWNTAVSFLTNTNWQNYAGESAMSC